MQNQTLAVAPKASDLPVPLQRRRSRKPTWQLSLMLIPAATALLLFNYFPMAGIVIAFQRYEPLKGFFNSEWVGLLHFQRIFSRTDFWQLLQNTVFIASL